MLNQRWRNIISDKTLFQPLCLPQLKWISKNLRENIVPDIVSQKHRSAMMAAVRQKNTRPEIMLRQALFRAGLRFRIHRRDLPGTPDIVFPSKRTVIFVQGCFWHRHHGCKRSTFPATRTEFWAEKFSRNIERDKKVQNRLKASGWQVLVVWECQVLTSESARGIARTFLRELRRKNSSSKRLDAR
jgi:DNA mismatch endonuclease (patch repair protein)